MRVTAGNCFQPAYERICDKRQSCNEDRWTYISPTTTHPFMYVCMNWSYIFWNKTYSFVSLCGKKTSLISHTRNLNQWKLLVKSRLLQKVRWQIHRRYTQCKWFNIIVAVVMFIDVWRKIGVICTRHRGFVQHARNSTEQRRKLSGLVIENTIEVLQTTRQAPEKGSI